MSRLADASVVVIAIVSVSIAVDLTSIHHSIDAQTAALERIAEELKPPLHSETTITKVDAGVCDTLGNALKADVKRGRK